MSHDHKIIDTDVSFVIDPVSRSITTTSDKKILMQYDHNSERYTFRMPRSVEGHDVSLSDRIDIHYNNLSSNAVDMNQNIYNVDDITVDGDNVCFTWLVSRNATMYAGSLNFIVSISCFDEDGSIVYSWHSDIYKNIRVSACYDYSDTIVEEYSDILQQWYYQLVGTGTSAISDIETAKTEAISEIENEASRVAESILEDYSELLNEVTDIRVGIDGTTYNSAGTAIRTQIAAMDSGMIGLSAGDNIKIENSTISVMTTDDVEQDNTKPLTSAGAYVVIGNIESLLSII